MQGNGSHGRIANKIIPLAILFLLIIVDQLTKCYFHQYYNEGNRDAVTVIENFLFWDVSFNTGAAFSLFQGQEWAQILFIALTVIALGAILFYWMYVREKYVFVKYGLAILAAGIIGNFIDRLAFGYVVDFISVKLWYGYFPTFNVADSAITVGVIMFIIHFLFLDAECLFCSKKRREERKARVAAIEGKPSAPETESGKDGK